MNILLSIHPYYAERIIDGSKTVELRKRIPRLTTDDRVYLYATCPVQQVVAAITVADICHGSPHALWRKVKDIACISYADYSRYFSGHRSGYRIVIGKVERFSSPLSLGLLKRSWPSFVPPQSFRYVPEHLNHNWWKSNAGNQPISQGNDR